MERTRGRRWGAKAAVWAVTVSTLLLASAAGVGAQPEPGESSQVGLPARPALELPATPELPGVVIFPARAAGPRPLTVLLHGMCGNAARTCSHFAEQVTQSAHLICPRASQRCSGGGSSWPEQGVAEAVEAAVIRAKAELSGVVDESHGRTLIGYSLGAYRALHIAQGGAGKYPRVMLIGAKVSFDRERLADNGVERLLLCAGAWDMMHDPMQRETQRLQRLGVQARFLGLGPVGHAFTASFANYLPSALSWLSGA